jgi:hypothetical protein
MLFSRPLASMFLIPVAACLFHAGCVKQQPPVEEKTPSDIPKRIQMLLSSVDELDKRAQQLPGEDDAANRKLVAPCFEALTRALPLIEGDYQRLRTLKTTQERLASPSATLASEPTIGQGLRATESLLRNLNRLVFDNDADLGKQIDAFQQKIIESDTVHDATYRVVTGQAIRGVAEITHQMTSKIVERAGTDGTPTTKPTTNPTANPTTNPTTAPATAPVSAPAPKPETPANP